MCVVFWDIVVVIMRLLCSTEAFTERFEAYLRVNRSVLIQAHRVSEGFSADPALKRPRSAVRPPYMYLQPVRG